MRGNVPPLAMSRGTEFADHSHGRDAGAVLPDVLGDA